MEQQANSQLITQRSAAQITQLNIPSCAMKFILYQRTAYIDIETHKIYRRMKRYVPFIYDKLVALVALMNAKTVKAAYNSDIKSEYITIKDHLPGDCSCILDIGCGIAGIDVPLFQHYGSQGIAFYLLDKTKVENRVFYNFNQHGAFYNSLSIAKKTLMLNGVPGKDIHLLEATEQNDINMDRRADLVISLISWGFHYPVSTYLDRVYELLSDNGMLIIDVRKNTGGMEQLEEKFRTCRVILDAAKHNRVLCKK